MRLTTKKTETFYVPDDADRAWIRVRLLSDEEIARIEAACTETSADDKGQARMVLNPYGRANGVAYACMEEWGEFFDEKGQLLKYSNKNMNKVSKLSVLIDGKLVRFLEWVDQCHAELYDNAKVEMEESEKN